MTDFRGCAWSKETLLVLTSNSLVRVTTDGAEVSPQSEEPMRGGLSLSRSGDLAVNIDQSVQVIGKHKKSFVCSASVTQAERLSEESSRKIKLVTIGGTDSVNLYVNGVLSNEIKLGNSEIATCIDVSDDQTLVAVGCASGAVYFANTETFAFRLVSKTLHNSAVRKLRIVSASFVASASNMGTVHIADALKQQTAQFNTHKGRVTGLEGRGNKLVSCGIDGKLFFYNSEHNLPLRSLHVTFPILGFCLAPDGQSVFVCGPEGQRNLIDICSVYPFDAAATPVALMSVEPEEELPIVTPPVEQEEQEADETLKMLYGDF